MIFFKHRSVVDLMSDNATQWYKDAVIYQVYPRGLRQQRDGTANRPTENSITCVS